MVDVHCTGIRPISRWTFLNTLILFPVGSLEAASLRRVCSLRSKLQLKRSRRRKQDQGKQQQLKAGLAFHRRPTKQVNIDDKPQKQLHPLEATRAYSLLHAQYLLDLGSGREAPVIEEEAQNPHLSRRVGGRHRPILLLGHPVSVRQRPRHNSQLHLQLIKHRPPNPLENMGHRPYRLSQT